MLSISTLSHETIALTIRKHWFIFFLSIARDLVLFLVPLPVVWFLRTTFPEFSSDVIVYTIAVLFLSTYYLLILVFSFVKLVDLYLDVWVVTTERVVGIEQKGMFSRVESEHRFDRIQDITVEVHGIVATFLNFGELHVQTAGETTRFVFKHASDPYTLKKKLIKLIGDSRVTL